MLDRLTGARRRALAFAVGAAAVALAAVVAAGGRRDGEAGSSSATDADIPRFVIDAAFTLAVVGVIGAVVVALLVFPPTHSRRARTGVPLDVIGLAVFAVAVFAGVKLLGANARPLEGPQEEDDPAFPQVTEPRPTKASKADRDAGASFRWEIAAAVGGAALAGAAVYVVRRRREGEELPDLPGERLADAFDLSIDDLRSEPDPRRAVVAAYARAERVLAASGLERRAAETPLEYLSRVLASLSVRAEAVLELTQLFERAKFSAHAIGDDLRRDAIAALLAVRDDLRGERA